MLHNRSLIPNQHRINMIMYHFKMIKISYVLEYDVPAYMEKVVVKVSAETTCSKLVT